MPKFVKESDRGRFRIIPIKTDQYIIQEQKNYFFNLFEFWRVVGWETDWGITPSTFVSSDEAKAYIDKLILEEEEAAHHQRKGVIYYP